MTTADRVIELHGPVAAAHDRVTRSVLGASSVASFDVTIAAIEEARSHGVDVIVVSLASRSSMRVLRELGALVTRLGARGWCIVAPWREPSLALPQLPRAALCMPFVLDAAVHTRSARLETWIAGAPLCLMGPHHGLALGAARAASGGPCDVCPARSRCEGLGTGYRATFGDGELRAIAAVPDPHDTAIARTLRAALAVA